MAARPTPGGHPSTWASPMDKGKECAQMHTGEVNLPSRLQTGLVMTLSLSLWSSGEVMPPATLLFRRRGHVDHQDSLIRQGSLAAGEGFGDTD